LLDLQICGAKPSGRGGCIEDGPKLQRVPALRCSKGAPKYRAIAAALLLYIMDEIRDIRTFTYKGAVYLLY
jgi:hypothetical protein